MKRGWMIVLLLSLGLNLGLGLGVLRRDGPPPPAPRERRWEPRDDERAPAMAERFMRKRIGDLARRLDLDADQQHALTAIYERTGPEVFRHRQEMRDQRRQIRELILAPDADWAEVAAGLQEQVRLQAVLDSLVVRVMFEERQLLTGPQLDQYRQFTSPLGERHGGERPGRGRHGTRNPTPPPRP
jgi:Spy/CpxP family protein refolding chaperone